MFFDINALLKDPLLGALLASAGKGKQSNPNIFIGPDGVYRNIPPENPQPPAEDRWALYGEAGGRGFVAPSPTQSVSALENSPAYKSGNKLEQLLSRAATMRNSEPPLENLPLEMQINFLRNQGVSAGMTERDALQAAEVAVSKLSGLDQKSQYTDASLQIAEGKRRSEEESRIVREQEGEANRLSREAIKNADIRLKQLDAKSKWSQNAIDELAAFARTKIQDPRTRIDRFPNDQEMSIYEQRLMKIPGALEPLSDPAIAVEPPQGIVAPPADNTSKSGGENKAGGAKVAIDPRVVQIFKQEAMAMGIPKALSRLLASNAVPQELKEELKKMFSGAGA